MKLLRPILIAVILGSLVIALSGSTAIVEQATATTAHSMSTRSGRSRYPTSGCSVRSPGSPSTRMTTSGSSNVRAPSPTTSEGSSSVVRCVAGGPRR
jgi:hypothetical protein